MKLWLAIPRSDELGNDARNKANNDGPKNVHVQTPPLLPRNERAKADRARGLSTNIIAISYDSHP